MYINPFDKISGCAAEWPCTTVVLVVDVPRIIRNLSTDLLIKLYYVQLAGFFRAC